MLKKASWIVVLAIAVLAACKSTDGQCYRRGEGPGGGVGGSVIVPGGPGGFGDVPPEPQDSDDPPPECVPDETELSEVVCGKSSWGALACVAACEKEGVWCPAGFSHPTKTHGKMYLLFKCCGCKGKQQCGYIDPDDTSRKCTYFPGFSADLALCQVN